MISVDVKVRGQAGVLRAMRSWAAAFPEALRAALYAEGQEWMDDAEPRAPEQTGFLKSSGFVTEPTGSLREPQVEIGFGAAYAGDVHRRAHPASGVPHWLGDTMQAKIPGLARRVLGKTRALAYSKRGVAGVPHRWPTMPKSGEGPRGSTSSGPRGGKR